MLARIVTIQQNLLEAPHAPSLLLPPSPAGTPSHTGRSPTTVIRCITRRLP